jgi:hypothetical protein
MDDAKIDEMIHDLLDAIDYDIAKDYREDTAEEPDDVEDRMDALRGIVRQYAAQLHQTEKD